MMTVMSALVILIRFALVVCVCACMNVVPMYINVGSCSYVKHCNFMLMATVARILVFSLGVWVWKPCLPDPGHLGFVVGTSSDLA